jgi:hypothetical protein
MTATEQRARGLALPVNPDGTVAAAACGVDGERGHRVFIAPPFGTGKRQWIGPAFGFGKRAVHQAIALARTLRGEPVVEVSA